jgi:redox-sensing transcriptional repressor
MKLPEKTVERLSQYRRILLNYQFLEKPYIFSRDLARMLKINPVHIRRDLMLLGVSGSHARGYDVQNLISQISVKLECLSKKNACIVGFGHMGRAVLDLFVEGGTPIDIVAIFDLHAKSVNKSFYGVDCFSMEKMEAVIAEKNISLAILATTDDDVNALKDLLVACGIKGMMNLTSQSIEVPKQIHLEEYDLKTSLIKLTYFSETKPAKL